MKTAAAASNGASGGGAIGRSSEANPGSATTAAAALAEPIARSQWHTAQCSARVGAFAVSDTVVLCPMLNTPDPHARSSSHRACVAMNNGTSMPLMNARRVTRPNQRRSVAVITYLTVDGAQRRVKDTGRFAGSKGFEEVHRTHANPLKVRGQRSEVISRSEVGGDR